MQSTCTDNSHVCLDWVACALAAVNKVNTDKYKRFFTNVVIAIEMFSSLTKANFNEELREDDFFLPQWRHSARTITLTSFLFLFLIFDNPWNLQGAGIGLSCFLSKTLLTFFIISSIIFVYSLVPITQKKPLSTNISFVTKQENTRQWTFKNTLPRAKSLLPVFRTDKICNCLFSDL